MKISTSQLFDASIAQMNRQQSNVAEMQAKLASGKNLVKPSDDAEKATLIQRLNSAMQRQDVFDLSLDRAESRLRTEESALMGVEDMLQRIRELAIQGSNDTLSNADRTIIAKEVTSLRDGLFSLANTQDESGNYIFSGTKVKTPAFSRDADGVMTYEGDQNQTSVDISEYRQVSVNRPGDEIFSSVSRTSDNDNSANIGFFKVIDDFIDALEVSSGTNISQGLQEISTLTDDMALSLADLGSRMNTVDNQRDILADTKLRYQELLSNAEDLDYATAVTKLSAQMLSLEAAQASFAKISQLNLFNYLRQSKLMTEVSNVANTVLTTLDIGSGIDSTKLARDLTDAIKIPQQSAIQGKIDASDNAISGYGLVKFQLDTLKGSFEKLNDANELATSNGTSSDITKMTVSSLAGTADAGAYDFTISQLAQNQRVTSDQYMTKTQSLNGGSAFDISVAVGTTKSAVTAVYNATATASETTTLVVSDGTNTVSVASATYGSIAAQVAAIQGATGYGNLLFTVAENSDGDGIAFTYKTAGSVASTPTFTGSGSTHTITNPTVGVSVPTAVTGVAAEYDVTGTAAETTTLVVSDGSTTVSVDSATYGSLAAQVTAIKAGTGYENLKFTVAINDAGNGFKFIYKTTGAVTTAPTLTGTGSNHSVTTTTAGVTAVNAPTTTTINISTDTPAGVVSAINKANTGVTATLVDTGLGSNTYRIVLAGQTGSDGIFNLTSSPDLGFHDTANLMQSAQDSIIGFEGLTLTRSSNTLTDVIDGASINLMATTASNTRITISNDISTLKTNIKDMVTAYNDLLGLFDELTATDDTTDLAGALSEDGSMVRFLKNKTRDVVFAESSTPSGTITSLRDIGVSVNQYGTITFTEATYDLAISSKYDDIVTMLTADTNNQNLFETSNKGLAQDIATAIGDMTDATGVVTVRQTGAKSDLAGHEDELAKLEARMERVYDRYLMQFGAMETLMATLDSTKDYLTSQFETLSKAYDVDQRVDLL